ncbi:MAG: InlB B-repeat-containing protein [Myxococcales bacterium]
MDKLLTARFAMFVAAASLIACGSAPNLTGCQQTSDCTGDAVCAQNVCQQGLRLSLTPAGDGVGRITSSPDGFNCSTACSAPLAAGTEVTLHAIPDSNSIFAGWSGACAGTADCHVTMDDSKSATASFRSTHVVFSSAMALDGSDAAEADTVNIWRVKGDGSGLEALTGTSAAGVTNWLARSSPDGTQIVFESSRSLDGSSTASSTMNIWKMNADGSGIIPLTRGTATGDSAGGMMPEWSPDGKHVVFVSQRNLDGSDTPNPVPNLWRVNADGSGLSPLTASTGADIAILFTKHFSPDGAQIVFTSNRNPDGTDTVSPTSAFNLWRVRTDGSGLSPLTRATASSSFLPHWSPDGKTIVFASDRNVDLTDTLNPSTVFNIWRINADGTGLVPLTRGTVAGILNLAPRWSPDGSRIVFTSSMSLDGSNAPNTGSTANVWTVNADGTGLAPLTRATATGDGAAMLPQWSLDGSRIFFSSTRKLDGSDATNGPDSTANLWRVEVKDGSVAPLTRITAKNAGSSSCATGGSGTLCALAFVAALALLKRRRGATPR